MHNTPVQQTMHSNTEISADRVRHLSAQLVAISAELPSLTIPPTATVQNTGSGQSSGSTTKTHGSQSTCENAITNPHLFKTDHEIHHLQHESTAQYDANTIEATTTVNGAASENLFKDLKWDAYAIETTATVNGAVSETLIKVLRHELAQLRAEKASADIAAAKAETEKRAVEKTLSLVSQERDELVLQANLLENQLACVRKERSEKIESLHFQLEASMKLQNTLQETIEDLSDEVKTLQEDKDLREPLFDIGRVVRMRYIHQMIGAHTAHSPNLRVIKAGDTAADRTNIIADNCLVSLGYCGTVEKQVLQKIYAGNIHSRWCTKERDNIWAELANMRASMEFSVVGVDASLIAEWVQHVNLRLMQHWNGYSCESAERHVAFQKDPEGQKLLNRARELYREGMKGARAHSWKQVKE